MNPTSSEVRRLLTGSSHETRSRAARLEVWATALAFQMGANQERVSELRIEAVQAALGGASRSIEVRLAVSYDQWVHELGEEQALKRLRAAEPEFGSTTLDAFLVVQSLVQPLEP